MEGLAAREGFHFPTYCFIPIQLGGEPGYSTCRDRNLSRGYRCKHSCKHNVETIGGEYREVRAEGKWRGVDPSFVLQRQQCTTWD
jgi:hypothetical protein